MNNKPRYKGRAKGTPIEIFDLVGEKPTPSTFLMGREVQMRVAEWQDTIWAAIEAQETGDYVISGETRAISGTDFMHFQFGAAQILYNQSYQSGNTETNSGLTTIVAKGMEVTTGHTYYEGHIVTSLNDLCRLSYGVAEPSTKQKHAMEKLLLTLHRNFVTIQYPNGDTREQPLVVIRDRYTRAKDGAVFYWLSLSPIFCENVKKNFSEFPQDLTKRLTAVTKRTTDSHLHLINLLGAQMRTKSPYTITIPVLMKKLQMESVYKSNRGRAEKQLLSICDDILKMGQITKYETETEVKRGKQALSKIRFYLNPNFARKKKRKDEEQTDY